MFCLLVAFPEKKLKFRLCYENVDLRLQDFQHYVVTAMIWRLCLKIAWQPLIAHLWSPSICKCHNNSELRSQQQHHQQQQRSKQTECLHANLTPSLERCACANWKQTCQPAEHWVVQAYTADAWDEMSWPDKHISSCQHVNDSKPCSAFVCLTCNFLH